MIIFPDFSTITPIVGKKRKRNPSSDNSDTEVLPSQASPVEDEDSVQVLKCFSLPGGLANSNLGQPGGF